MADFVTVITCSTRTEAEVAKGLLRANGINSIIMADDAGGMTSFPMAYTYGAELKVAKKDVGKAKEILSKTG